MAHKLSSGISILSNYSRIRVYLHGPMLPKFSQLPHVKLTTHELQPGKISTSFFRLQMLQLLRKL